MGSSASATSSVNTKQFSQLIGDINKKSPVEQKFYKLCRAVRFPKVKKKKPISVDSDDESDFTEDLLTSTNAQKVPNQGETKEEPLPLSQREATPRSNLNFDDECEKACDLFKARKIRGPMFTTQTYVSWRAVYDLDKVRHLFRPSKRTIYLLPINDFPDFIQNFKLPLLNSEELSFFEVIQKFVEIFFLGMNVKWMENLNLECTKWKITSRFHKKTEKKQYLVSNFYPKLQKYKPKDGYCIMGMIWSDLYPREELNFVLGEASYLHKSGVFSFGRFEPKVYDKERHQDIMEVNTDIMWKVLKVCSHELCHLFGILHCAFFLCCMNESTAVQEALNQPLFLCPVCVRKLQHICNFDIVERYLQLQQFLVAMNAALPSKKWQDSVDWVNRCLQFLGVEYPTTESIRL